MLQRSQFVAHWSKAKASLGWFRERMRSKTTLMKAAEYQLRLERLVKIQQLTIILKLTSRYSHKITASIKTSVYVVYSSSNITQTGT